MEASQTFKVVFFLVVIGGYSTLVIFMLWRVLRGFMSPLSRRLEQQDQGHRCNKDSCGLERSLRRPSLLLGVETGLRPGLRPLASQLPAMNSTNISRRRGALSMLATMLLVVVGAQAIAQPLCQSSRERPKY